MRTYDAEDKVKINKLLWHEDEGPKAKKPAKRDPGRVNCFKRIGDGIVVSQE